MSEQQDMQEQQPLDAEVTKKTSVYELPSLPVEFPPKDDEESLLETQPRRSVTFEVEDTVNLCVCIHIYPAILPLNGRGIMCGPVLSTTHCVYILYELVKNVCF